MIIRLTLALSILFLSYGTFGQTFKITGKVTDAADTSPLIGVTAIVSGVSDTADKNGAITDDGGNFEITNLHSGNYNLRLEYTGYKSVKQTISVTYKDIFVGIITMKASVNELKGVTIAAKQIRAEQNGDTSQFHADAYKTNPDATAEDLVTKMPGVSSDNTGVKVNGEAVQQVYVDGKPFFGTDPSLALKNMPAEIIDKIQVFDKLSDQSTFTGFDDGNAQKTMNIITKKGKNDGVFGKVYAGYGTDDTYIAGGNLNFFNGDRRISLIGLSNNINQQNFSSQDILGISGSGSGQNRGGGGRGGNGGGNGANNFLVGQQNGITSTNSFGFNYSDNWGKKIKVTGSYFFNNTDNKNATELTRNYFTTSDTANIYHENDNSETKNYNHRINLRLEYTPDSFNSIVFTPAISFQQNNSGSQTFASDSLGNTLSSITNNNNNAFSNGYSSSNNNLLLQHKFKKRRRTISLNLGSSINEKTGDGSYYSLNDFYASNTTTLRDQHYNLYNNGYNVSSNLTYTEPVGKKGQIMANYNPSYAKSSSDKETYDRDSLSDYSIPDTLFSNKYNTTYVTQKGGLNYRIGDRKLTFSFGANVQYATLDGSEIFPHVFSIRRNFTDVLPSAFFNYRYADGRNLRIMYRTNTTAPSVTQLQDLVDISNPLLLKTGNSELKQDYEQTFIVRYGLTKSKTARNFFLNLYVNYINNYIGNATYIPGVNSIFTDPVTFDTIQVNKGSQLTRPVNLDGFWNMRSFLTYGMPVDLIKCNLNLSGGFNFTRTPGQINTTTVIANSVANFSNNYIPSFGIVLSSNISQALDFTLAYNGNYNIVTNTTQALANNNYYNHIASFRINYLLLKKIVFNTNLSHNYYTAFSSTGDQSYFLWNAYIGYKMLKNNALEARITAYDILNQNKSINRTVTETYIENSVTQVLKQYFLFQLTYTLREFKGTQEVRAGGENDYRPWREHIHGNQ